MLSRKKSTPAAPSPLEKVLADGLKAFAAHLPAKGFPDAAALSAAGNAATQHFREALGKPALLAQLGIDEKVITEHGSAAKLDFSQWVHRNAPPVAKPQYSEQLNGIRLAIAAMLGTLAGGLGISGLLKLLLPAAEIPAATPYGYLIGSVIGAAAAIYLVWQTSDSSSVRNWLKGILGLATIGEVFLLVQQASGLGMIWRTLRGAAGRGIFRFFKRLILYVAIVILLKVSVKQPHFQRQSYLDTMGIIYRIWLKHAVTFLKNRFSEASAVDRPAADLPDPRSQLKALGIGLHKLHQSPADSLPDAAAEILVKAAGLGFRGLDQQPLFLTPEKTAAGEQTIFTWQHSMEKDYQVIGIVEEGDPVFVESVPVIHNGEVIEKGTVRKLRRKPQ